MNLNNFFKDFKSGMKEFGTSISTLVNSILLATVYFIGIGLTSIFAKLFKKHFLNIKQTSKKDTYWSDLDLKKKPIEEYYRQF